MYNYSYITHKCHCALFMFFVLALMSSFAQTPMRGDVCDYEEDVSTLIKEMSEAKKNGDVMFYLRTQLTRADLGRALMGMVHDIRIVDSVIVEYSQLSDVYSDFLVSIGEDVGSRLFSSLCVNENNSRRLQVLKDERGEMRLTESVRVGTTWSLPICLPEFKGVSGNVNFPYLSDDGRTLYYSVQNEATLGGYDIYVSYLDDKTGSFSAGRNIGFPFNSPANDFLFVWDEQRQYGKFATDRNTPIGYVCVYTFMRADSVNRFCYNMDKADLERFARTGRKLSDTISNDMTDNVAQTIKAIIKQKKLSRKAKTSEHSYYITDHVVYNDISNFKSPNAARIAEELSKHEEVLLGKKQLLEEKRKNYHTSPNEQLKSDILNLEEEVEITELTIEKLNKNMRKAELKI